MRIVFDSASFVTAVRSSEGAAREILGMILRGEVAALMDLKLGLEYRDVALRQKHLDASDMTALEVLRLIQVLESVAEFVQVEVKTRPLSPDPDDDMVLDLAIAGKAEVVITMNKKHFLPQPANFGFDVLTPAEFPAEIEKRRWKWQLRLKKNSLERFRCG